MTQAAIEAECCRWPPRLPNWGIFSASLRHPDAVAALRRQDGLFSVIGKGDGCTTVDLVGSIRETAYVPSQSANVFSFLARKSTQIITLTITSAGYCMDAHSGRLDPAHPDIQRDLRTGTSTSAIALLVRGLSLRRSMGLQPPVVLSCDNVPFNGSLLRQVCMDYAALVHDGLAQWIEGHVQFPSTMVDRIVPGTVPGASADTVRYLGMEDAASVTAERYLQWVVEEFEGPRPLWEAAGAEFVPDVGPWQASKLRLLNGGHLVVAYLGLQAGYQCVHEAMADPLLAQLVQRFMLDEQMPTLPHSNHDIPAYVSQLLVRWRNPAIAHRLDRIGRDSANKVIGRLLDPLQENMRDRRRAPCTLLALAAWMRCVASETPVGGVDIGAVSVLSTAPTASALLGHGDAASLVDVFLDGSQLFPESLRRDAGLRAGLYRAMQALTSLGTDGAMAACLRGELN